MVTSRIRFTAAQKAELWERWKNGQSRRIILASRRNGPPVQRTVRPCAQPIWKPRAA